MHTIRIADNTDTDAIRGIDHLIAAEPVRGEVIHAATARGDCIMLEIDGAVAGYGICKPDFFGHSFIGMVYLAEDYREQGYGAEMLAYMQKMAVTDRIFTSCNQSNTRMQHVLTREGWRYSGFIDNLDPGDPELIYCKFV